MAIASLTQHSKNVAFEQVIKPGLVSVVYRNGEFLPLFPQVASQGGSQYEWRVNTAGNTSAEVFSEGGSQPVPVAQTYVMASLSYIYFRAMVRITGHLRDAIKGQAVPAQFNVIGSEFVLGGEDLSDLMNTTFLGTGNNGLGLAVDSAGTYANIAKGTVTEWASYEDSNTVTHAVLMDMRTALRDNDRGGKMDLLLMPWTEVEAVQELVGAPGDANAAHRIDLTASGGAMNIAPSLGGTMFGDARVVGVGDSTDDVIFGLNHGDFAHVIHRDLDLRKDLSGDDDVYQLSCASTLVCHNTRRQGKITSA